MPPEPRLRFVRPSVPSSEKWVPFLGPAYAAGRFSNHGPVVQRVRAGAAGVVRGPGTGCRRGLKRHLRLGRDPNRLTSPGSCRDAGLHLPSDGTRRTSRRVHPGLLRHRSGYLGARPRAAAEAIEAAGCVAIIHVRAFGLCRDTSEVEALAARVGVPLIMDSAAAFGGHTEGGPALGAGGAAEVFSFHATKPFGIGEGELSLRHRRLPSEFARSSISTSCGESREAGA